MKLNGFRFDLDVSVPPFSARIKPEEIPEIFPRNGRRGD